MAQVIIRNIDDKAIAYLKSKAARHKHSLEQELREIILSAVKSPRQTFLMHSSKIRKTLKQKPQTDSLSLLRKDRDR